MFVQVSCWLINYSNPSALIVNLDSSDLVILRACEMCASRICMAADHNAHGFMPNDSNTFPVEITMIFYQYPDTLANEAIERLTLDMNSTKSSRDVRRLMRKLSI